MVLHMQTQLNAPDIQTGSIFFLFDKEIHVKFDLQNEIINLKHKLHLAHMKSEI